MVQLILVTLVVVAIIMLLLGFRVFFTKRWGFPNTHVEGNKALAEKGLTCHRSQHQEMIHHKDLRDRLAEERGE